MRVQNNLSLFYADYAGTHRASKWRVVRVFNAQGILPGKIAHYGQDKKPEQEFLWMR